jgi:hypothetical protein
MAGLSNKHMLKMMLDRCDFIKIQIENIEGECESGALTPEDYMEKVEEYIQFEIENLTKAKEAQIENDHICLIQMRINFAKKEIKDY